MSKSVDVIFSEVHKNGEGGRAGKKTRVAKNNEYGLHNWGEIMETLAWRGLIILDRRKWVWVGGWRGCPSFLHESDTFPVTLYSLHSFDRKVVSVLTQHYQFQQSMFSL